MKLLPTIFFACCLLFGCSDELSENQISRSEGKIPPRLIAPIEFKDFTANDLTGGLRLLVACDPEGDSDGAYDDHLLRAGFEDEHCRVQVEGTSYFLADVAEPLQPGRVGELLQLRHERIRNARASSCSAPCELSPIGQGSARGTAGGRHASALPLVPRDQAAA